MWLWEKVPCAPYDWLAVGSDTPSQLQAASHGLSLTPGSVNVPLNVAGTKTSGPERPVLVPLKAVIVGGTFPTVTLNVVWPTPPSLSVTFTVTVFTPLSAYVCEAKPSEPAELLLA